MKPQSSDIRAAFGWLILIGSGLVGCQAASGLLADSPPTTREEQAAIGRNQLAVARRGRDSSMVLERHGKHREVCLY